MKGVILGENVNLILWSTPISRQVASLYVYLPERESWSIIKDEYNMYVRIFTEKYESPNSSLQSFNKPYLEGDGQEVSVIKSEKCHYSTSWVNIDNASLRIEISQYMQIKLTYENYKNMQIIGKEREQQIKNIY